MWFGLLCIRLVTVFLAQFPWKSLNEDFHCNSSDSFCIKACFNKHFDNSIVMAWHFLFILLVLSVLLMELFSSHLRSSFQKKNEKEMTSQSEQGAGTDPTMTVGGRLNDRLPQKQTQCGGVPVQHHAADCSGGFFRVCLVLLGSA